MNASFNRFLLFLLLISIAGCSRTETQIDSVVQPNVILFLVDDLGWQDSSVAFWEHRTGFNEQYETPNLEKLATNGIRFTHAYSASPVCTPTRVSIATGSHPARTRVTNWTLQPDREQQETAPDSYPLVSPDWNHLGLQSDSLTLYSLLKSAGYRTIHAGKAHFGARGTPGADPLNLGFDVNIAGHAAGAPGSFLGQDNYGNSEDGSPWGVPGLESYHGTDTFLTDAITSEVLPHIRAAVEQDVPFFLNMAPYAVHIPLAPYEPYYTEYRDRGLDEAEAKYASMIVAVDESLGRLLATLNDLDVAEETLIIFTSDNGGLSYARRGMTPEGTGANTHNAPLRSGKGSAYEGGIRVPMVISWGRTNPDNPVQQLFPIDPGTSTSVPVVSQDLYPTILNLAGVSRTSTVESDGRAIQEVLRAENEESTRPLFWHYPHKWGPEGPGLDPFTSVIEQNWKLIYFYRNRTWELYDLASDIGETNNLLSVETHKAKDLSGTMTERMRDIGAQLPVNRESGIPEPFPNMASK